MEDELEIPRFPETFSYLKDENTHILQSPKSWANTTFGAYPNGWQIWSDLAVQNWNDSGMQPIREQNLTNAAQYLMHVCDMGKV